MKMNLKLFGYMSILVMGATFASCGSDTTDTPTPQPVAYTWSKDGAISVCDHLLFVKDTNYGTNNENDANGSQIGNGEQEFVFKGKQTIKKGTYLLKGWVYVASGSELTIEPGTVIKGDKDTKAALIVEPGGKLFAQGNASSPIVFTSEQAKGQRKPGDWGGIILCGNAKNNQGQMQIEGGPRTKHGGTNDADNSGILSYVRIEFAGYPFKTDQEINGLTLGSVGSGTQIDHIQVSYSNDDSYEWFGGAVNCKYLIAYKGWDDEFDTDNGFSGHVQYGLSIKDSRIADQSQSNGFESDNNASGSTVDPHTSAVFSNMTFVGPKFVDASFQNTTDYINGGTEYPNNGSSLGKFQVAMHIRRDSHLNCFNSVAVGYPIGLILDNEKGDTQGAATAGKLTLNNIIFAGMDVTGTDYNKIYQNNLVTDYTTKPVTMDTNKASFSSTFFLAQTGCKALTNMGDLKLNTTAPFMPQSGSMLLSGASFTNSLLASYFDKVNFIGAFGTENWTAGWTNFDPVNADY